MHLEHDVGREPGAGDEGGTDVMLALGVEPVGSPRTASEGWLARSPGKSRYPSRPILKA